MQAGQVQKFRVVEDKNSESDEHLRETTGQAF